MEGKEICICGHKKSDHLTKIFIGTCGYGNCLCSEYRKRGS